ncbi:DsrE family protein [Desulfogranum mediterraneum]|uniref:DsrE family protein n=1 Tax=Desulfogranum mediterraneum TaxID=160661 RepID=UPI0004036B7C|nr:DsrE family protein [Desulfogranum mediterraneum]
MKKTVFFAFRGDPLCFIHVLLNGLDMQARQLEGKVILEGEAVSLVAEMARKDHFLHQLYTKAKEQQLFIGACKACANKLGATQAIEAEEIALIGEMSGHPAMADYIEQGYTVLTF